MIENMQNMDLNRISPQECKMYVQQEIKVRTYDVDYMQIVNNTVYVKWFENLRMAILDKYFPLSDMMAEGNSPILSETNIKYFHPMTLTSKPIGKAWISEIDRSRWVAHILICEGDRIYCEGRQTGYYFNLNRNKPVRFPKDFLEYYNSL